MWCQGVEREGIKTFKIRFYLPDPFLAQEFQKGSLSPLEPFNCKSDPQQEPFSIPLVVS